MSWVTSGPAARSSAATMSPTLTVSAGRLTGLRPPQAAPEAPAAQRSPASARAGEDSATSVCASTGHTARCAGQRLADDAGQEPGRGPVGPARADGHRHQPDGPAAQEALARVVGQQLLPDDLLHPIAGLRVRHRLVVDHGGQRVLGGVAEHGQRAGEHDHRLAARGPARGQQRLGGAQVGPQAEVEVGLAFRADRGGQMEDHRGAGERCPARTARPDQLAELAAQRGDPLVRGQVGGQRRLVGHGQLAQRPGRGARHRERPGGQQLPGQPGAEETRPTSDHHVRHGVPVLRPNQMRPLQ